MKYRNIIFDIDGTILNTEFSIVKSLQELLLELKGEHYELDQLKYCLGIPGNKTLEQHGFENIDEVQALWEEKMSKYYDTISVYEGIPELIHELRKMGCNIGVVSSETYDEFNINFRNLDLKDSFHTLVLADDTELHKPNGEPLLKELEKSGFSKEESVYIGDSIYDMHCAANAGIDFALVKWSNPNPEIKAKYYLEKPSDFLKIL